MLYRRNYLVYRLLDAFFRNWPPFVMAVVGVTVVVAVSLLLRNASYVAAASIRVIEDAEVSKVMGFVQQSWVTPSNRNASHFGDLMQDTRPGGFVNTALKTADLKVPILVDPQVTDPRFMKFRKSVYAMPQSNDVFAIGLTWPDKAECEKLVEALRLAYVEEAGLSRQSQAIATTQYLNSEIARYKKDLQKAERVVVQYKISHSGQLPGAQAASLEQYATLRMERDYLSITARDNELKSAALAQRIAKIKPTTILEQTISNDPLVQQLRLLEAKRISKAADWNPTGDQMRNLDNTIAATKRKIAAQEKVDPTQQRNVTETKLQDNPEYMSLTQQLTEAKISATTQKARMGLLDSKLAEYQASIAALPAAERDLTEKMRDYTLLQSQYEDLLKRRQQADLKANVQKITASSTLVPLNEVYAENTLGRTKKALILVGSVVVGIVIGLAVILFREWMDPSLRYETDAANLLGVPVLAGLPESPHLRFPAVHARKIPFVGRRQIPPVA